jgi:2,3-bisphosphoglycerate-independent phosphoglycerate mutase
VNLRVLGLPGLFGAAGDESIVRARPRPGLARFLERSAVKPLNPARGMKSASLLGLDGHQLGTARGPLTIAALGVDPPNNSVQFQLAVLSIEEGKATIPTGILPADQARLLFEAAKKLETRRLKLVPGEGWDHALVWEEGSLELGTTDPAAIQDLKSALPEGDGERMLRSFIDDSVNLLSELEFNHRRIDEGLSPLNLLWPWSPGFRPDVPNLGIQYGRVIEVFAFDLSLRGLARLGGMKLTDRHALGEGLPTRFEWLEKQVAKSAASLISLNTFAELRSTERWEEMDWFLAELDRRFLEPALSREDPAKWLILDPDAMAAQSSDFPDGLPFDERLLEEPRPPHDSNALVRDFWLSS